MVVAGQDGWRIGSIRTPTFTRDLGGVITNDDVGQHRAIGVTGHKHSAWVDVVGVLEVHDELGDEPDVVDVLRAGLGQSATAAAFHTRWSGPRPVGMPSGYIEVRLVSNCRPDPSPPWRATSRGTGSRGSGAGT